MTLETIRQKEIQTEKEDMIALLLEDDKILNIKSLKSSPENFYS